MFRRITLHGRFLTFPSHQGINFFLYFSALYYGAGCMCSTSKSSFRYPIEHSHLHIQIVDEPTRARIEIRIYIETHNTKVKFIAQSLRNIGNSIQKLSTSPASLITLNREPLFEPQQTRTKRSSSLNSRNAESRAPPFLCKDYAKNAQQLPGERR